MQQNHVSRLVLIATVLVVGILLIIPPGSMFRSDLTWSQKLNLKPGIDMVGGTSLTYEIKPAEGQIAQADLAERVMEALKKRVDPDGVRNLIWRPQGATRLEIQMPHSKQSGKAGELRKAFAEAERKLESTNVRPAAVLRAVETLTGDARAAELDKLAGGNTERATLFGALRSVWDQIQNAKSRTDAEAQAKAELEYDALREQLGKDTLASPTLQSVLEIPTKDERDRKLGGLKKQAVNFPERLAAIDAFEKTYADYSEVKGSLDDAQDLKRLLKGSGVLEFHILVTDWSPSDAAAMVKRLQETGPRPQQGDSMQWFVVDKPEHFKGAMSEYNGKQYTLCWTTDGRSMTNRPGALGGWALEDARRSTDQNGLSNAVAFTFNAAGAARFSELTSKNIGSPLAILLDDRVVSAPNINSTIGANGQITGDFSNAELNYLISTLNAGSLPAQLADDPIMEQTVGAQLGEDNLRRGLFSCSLGLIVVTIFLVLYYYLAGLVAMFAVLLNMVLILAVMAMLNATFTLPGVAALVLTIGTAVDANVLIFERLREEQKRGLSLKLALRNAYDRALTAIVDSNVTTAITALVLYWIGSEEVKGFGLTLLIGIVCSMFTSLFVTRTIFGVLVDKFGVTKLGSFPLSVPAWDRFLRPSIDWMSLAKYFYAFSAVFLAVGLGFFFYQMSKGQMFDIEFAKGTSVQFELKQKTDIKDIRKIVESYAKQDAASLPSPSVVSVGTDDRTYQIVTPNENVASVRTAIQSALGDRLTVEVQSNFTGSDQTAEQALAGGRVVAIKSAAQTIGGFVANGAAAHVGGAAIVLDNLTPPLSPSDVRKRIESQRHSIQSAESGYKEYAVESPAGNDDASGTLVVLASDPNFVFDTDPVKQAQWLSTVVAPMWDLTVAAVTRPPTFQQVNSFNPQVAGETSRDALIALALSILIIMAYIWIRFGDLKYATATVFALVHDTAFVLAGVGFAHLLADTIVGRVLLLEPFRINLTLVAGVLTIMGYSMIDTIVVFDRIRELRGKFGLADRQIINDAVNQTLSRTLLTAGTTIVNVAIMYFLGGSGIHGFTFVLFLGILVGTYSSIAMAAPLLLLGRKRSAVAHGGNAIRNSVRALQ